MSLMSEGAGLARPLRGEIAHAEPSMAGVGDFVALMKPRVMSLVVFTALAGLLLAPGHLHPVLGFTALLCIAVGAGAAGALNMWYDADIDAVMSRTCRPPDSGRPRAAERGACVRRHAGGRVGRHAWPDDQSAGGRALAFTILFYVVVYTMWLKRWTPQNIVIGGAAGAFPPMIGWAAATGAIGIESVLLVLIIFFWTPPHFWALSLLRADEYARAGVPMLPVVSGAQETRRQILIYSLVLAPIGASPWLFGYAGLAYGIVAMLGGVAMIALSWQLWRVPSDRLAKRLFTFSILYLFVLFAALLAERGLGLGGLLGRAFA